MSIIRTILVAYAVTVLPPAAMAQAQSLDIGGIELRRGMGVEEARRLLASYHLEYADGIGWLVWTNTSEQRRVIGWFNLKSNVITRIVKAFDLFHSEDKAEAYTRASEELRRRGSKVCSTTEVVYSDSLIRGFQTSCGAYSLQFSFAVRFRDAIIGEELVLKVGQLGPTP